jgi:hypothetical protein
MLFRLGFPKYPVVRLAKAAACVAYDPAMDRAGR